MEPTEKKRMSLDDAWDEKEENVVEEAEGNDEIDESPLISQDDAIIMWGLRRGYRQIDNTKVKVDDKYDTDYIMDAGKSFKWYNELSKEGKTLYLYRMALCLIWEYGCSPQDVCAEFGKIKEVKEWECMFPIPPMENGYKLS